MTLTRAVVSKHGDVRPEGHVEGSMQVEATRMYRVREVAEGLNVSVATIYRAIEAGHLAAVRLGTGSGVVRVSGAAVRDYLRLCETAAARQAGPTADADACSCGAAAAAVAS